VTDELAIRLRGVVKRYGPITAVNGLDLDVPEGTVQVLTEFYEPTLLNKGDSMYFDSRMGHCCLSTSPEDALVLWVCSR